MGDDNIKDTADEIRREKERMAQFFTVKEVAQAVKAAFYVGGTNSTAQFTPGQLAHICALAGLSEVQAKALWEELI